MSWRASGSARGDVGFLDVDRDLDVIKLVHHIHRLPNEPGVQFAVVCSVSSPHVQLDLERTDAPIVLDSRVKVTNKLLAPANHFHVLLPRQNQANRSLEFLCCEGGGDGNGNRSSDFPTEATTNTAELNDNLIVLHAAHEGNHLSGLLSALTCKLHQQPAILVVGRNAALWLHVEMCLAPFEELPVDHTTSAARFVLVQDRCRASLISPEAHSGLVIHRLGLSGPRHDSRTGRLEADELYEVGSLLGQALRACKNDANRLASEARRSARWQKDVLVANVGPVAVMRQTVLHETAPLDNIAFDVAGGHNTKESIA
mmetsp:Transcript_142/g.436  ORF Transcript_142/g.436 Transcript_142/m.436 type:complete len:314 (+) Transcript_142:1819-2760(+)